MTVIFTDPAPSADRTKDASVNYMDLVEFRDENPTYYDLVEGGEANWDLLASEPVRRLAEIGGLLIVRSSVDDADDVVRMAVDGYAMLLQTVDYAIHEAVKKKDRWEVKITLAAVL